jgi:UDP-N-acetylglucosamine 2-epimerase (non-hydrolysing)
MELRVTTRRMSVLISPPEHRSAGSGAWLRSAVAQHDGTTIAHLSTSAESVPRLAGALWAVEEASAFDQIVIDVSPDGGAEAALAELDLSVPVVRVSVASGGLPDALREELALSHSAALMLYADDGPALSGALSAARLGVSVIRVGRVPRGRCYAHAVARLADLVLVADADDALTLAPAIAAERIHVVGSPLIDVVRRCSREALSRAAWRRFAVEPGHYVLAVLSGEPDPALSSPLAALAAETPLVIEASPAWSDCVDGAVGEGARLVSELGFVDRLSLERAAAAIATNCERVHEEAAALGIRCHALAGPALTGEPSALMDLRPQAHAPTPRMIPLWDGHAGARLADVLVANFARLRLA